VDDAFGEKLKTRLVELGPALEVNGSGKLAADIVAPPDRAQAITNWLGAVTENAGDVFNVGGAHVRVYPCHHMPDEWHLVSFGFGCVNFHDLVDDAWRNQPAVIFGGGRANRFVPRARSALRRMD